MNQSNLLELFLYDEGQEGGELVNYNETMNQSNLVGAVSTR